MGVAAHAVDDHHQQGLVVRDEVDAILVLRPIARQAQLCIIDAHALLPSPQSLVAFIVVALAALRSTGAQPGRKPADVHSVPQR